MTSVLSRHQVRGSARLQKEVTRGKAADLGPFAAGLATTYLAVAFMLAAPVYPLEPYVWTLMLPLPFGALLLTPADRIRRMVIDGPALILIVFSVISLAWTLNQPQAIFEIRRDVPLLITASLIGSIVKPDVALKAIRSAMYLMITITTFGLILFPETRQHARSGLYVDDLPGWHGFFIHKNIMAPFLVFMLATVLITEERTRRRDFVVLWLAVLLVGSDSATGLTAAGLVIALRFWFRTFHASGERWKAGYVMSSILVGLVLMFGAMASLATIVQAYGKDLTFSGRTFIWTASLKAAADAPFLGYGRAGVFWRPANDVTRQIWRDVGFVVPHAHNGAIDVLLTYGIVGLVLVAVVLVTNFTKGLALVRRSPMIGEWVITISAAQLLMGFSENVFQGHFFLYLLVMRAIAQRTINDLDDAEPTLKPVEAPATLVRSGRR